MIGLRHEFTLKHIWCSGVSVGLQVSNLDLNENVLICMCLSEATKEITRLLLSDFYSN